jgi:hypothetical protein
MKSIYQFVSVTIAVTSVFVNKIQASINNDFNIITIENINSTGENNFSINDKTIDVLNGKVITKVPISFNTKTNNAFSYENLPSGVEKRIAQIFTASANDFSNHATVSLDAAFVGANANISNLRLIMGSDNNFANAEVYMPSASINGGAIEFQNVNLNAMKKFFAIAFADKDEHPNISVKNIEVLNFGNKQYALTWKATQGDDIKGTYKISYINTNNEKVVVKKTGIKQSGIDINYDIKFNLPEMIDQAKIILEFENNDKSLYTLGSVNDETDADGEVVELITEADFTALKVKTEAGTKGTFDLKLFNENGALVSNQDEIEILAGASQIIPIDLPTSPGMYFAVLTNTTSSRKKKKVFKVIHS